MCLHTVTGYVKLTENKYGKDRPSLCVCGRWGLALVVQSEPVRWHIPDTYCCLFTGIIVLGRLQLSSAAISSLTFTSFWRPLHYIWAYDQLNFILQETKAPTKKKKLVAVVESTVTGILAETLRAERLVTWSQSLHSLATVNLEKLFTKVKWSWRHVFNRHVEGDHANLVGVNYSYGNDTESAAHVCPLPQICHTLVCHNV